MRALTLGELDVISGGKGGGKGSGGSGSGSSGGSSGASCTSGKGSVTHCNAAGKCITITIEVTCPGQKK